MKKISLHVLVDKNGRILYTAHRALDCEIYKETRKETHNLEELTIIELKGEIK